MRLKKRTKRIIKYIVIGFMILALLLPIASSFLPQQQSGQIDPKLLQAYIDSQNENESEEIPEVLPPQIEGTYQVVDVPSGTTLTVLWGDEKKDIKLIGIKEVSSTKEALEQKIKNDFVQLEFDVIEEDENGVLLAYAYDADGTFINYDLILHGKAKMETNVSKNTKYITEFEDAQIKAINNQVGCWIENSDREDMKK